MVQTALSAVLTEVTAAAGAMGGLLLALGETGASQEAREAGAAAVIAPRRAVMGVTEPRGPYEYSHGEPGYSKELERWR